MPNDLSIPLDPQSCYAAIHSRDARFDGRFFVGVSSTGVYCRPICRVKTPRPENCSYFPSAAAAEAAGYRPCLKCRPELAPGLSPAEAPARLARLAALKMDEDGLADSGLARLAESLGVTDRHLRRVFLAEYGAPPVKYLQTRRLLLAKNLLTDTSLTVTEAALAAGFGSLRRFNDLFRKHYRLSPTDLRKQGREQSGTPAEGLTLLLGYRPPYDWAGMLDFLAGRSIPGLESVADDSYRRTVDLPHPSGRIRGWLALAQRPTRNALALTIAPALLPALPRVLARIRSMFDLDCQPLVIRETLAGLDEIKAGLHRPGLRLPGCFDPFEMSVRAILGQQITIKAARTLAGRLAAAFGEPLSTPFEDLSRTFPGPADLLRLGPDLSDHLGPLGIIGARCRSIAALARALTEGEISLSPGSDPEAEMSRLLALPGFGPWTVQYIAMRALNWPDAFPHTDYGVKKALEGRGPAEILALAEAWRPWRSYATMSLWKSLE